MMSYSMRFMLPGLLLVLAGSQVAAACKCNPNKLVDRLQAAVSSGNVALVDQSLDAVIKSPGWSTPELRRCIFFELLSIWELDREVGMKYLALLRYDDYLPSAFTCLAQDGNYKLMSDVLWMVFKVENQHTRESLAKDVMEIYSKGKFPAQTTAERFVIEARVSGVVAANAYKGSEDDLWRLLKTTDPEQANAMSLPEGFLVACFKNQHALSLEQTRRVIEVVGPNGACFPWKSEVFQSAVLSVQECRAYYLLHTPRNACDIEDINVFVANWVGPDYY